MDIPWTFAGVVAISFFVYKLATVKRAEKEAADARITSLKNGLLTLALMTVNTADIDDANFGYASFDGSKLPALSGCSTANACLSYILDRDAFRRSPMHSRHMERKLDAIDKYLTTHFDTDAKVAAFIERYAAATAPSRAV